MMVVEKVPERLLTHQQGKIGVPEEGRKEVIGRRPRRGLPKVGVHYTAGLKERVLAGLADSGGRRVMKKGGTLRMGRATSVSRIGTAIQFSQSSC